MTARQPWRFRRCPKCQAVRRASEYRRVGPHRVCPCGYRGPTADLRLAAPPERPYQLMLPAAPRTPVRVRWTAGPDGIAHAHAAGGAVCHVPAIAERDAWPTFTRCPACLRVVADDAR
jgi:uncharacterized C2H2 Zn-finger protein